MDLKRSRTEVRGNGQTGVYDRMPAELRSALYGGGSGMSEEEKTAQYITFLKELSVSTSSPPAVAYDEDGMAHRYVSWSGNGNTNFSVAHGGGLDQVLRLAPQPWCLTHPLTYLIGDTQADTLSSIAVHTPGVGATNHLTADRPNALNVDVPYVNVDPTDHSFVAGDFAQFMGGFFVVEVLVPDGASVEIAAVGQHEARGIGPHVVDAGDTIRQVQFFGGGNRLFDYDVDGKVRDKIGNAGELKMTDVIVGALAVQRRTYAFPVLPTRVVDYKMQPIQTPSEVLYTVGGTRNVGEIMPGIGDGWSGVDASERTVGVAIPDGTWVEYTKDATIAPGQRQGFIMQNFNGLGALAGFQELNVRRRLARSTSSLAQCMIDGQPLFEAKVSAGTVTFNIQHKMHYQFRTNVSSPHYELAKAPTKISASMLMHLIQRISVHAGSGDSHAAAIADSGAKGAVHSLSSNESIVKAVASILPIIPHVMTTPIVGVTQTPDHDRLLPKILGGLTNTLGEFAGGVTSALGAIWSGIGGFRGATGLAEGAAMLAGQPELIPLIAGVGAVGGAFAPAQRGTVTTNRFTYPTGKPAYGEPMPQGYWNSGVSQGYGGPTYARLPGGGYRV